MKGFFSQIVIGIIVTVVGTVIATAVIKGGGKALFGGSYHSGSSRGR